MADLIDFDSVRQVRPRHPGADGRVLFERRELQQLLTFYSRRVMAGEWRDYAIDFGAKSAAFSVFRHASEAPLFAIVKLPTGRDKGRFLLASGRAIVRRAHNLAELLRLIDSKPRLVCSNI